MPGELIGMEYLLTQTGEPLAPLCPEEEEEFQEEAEEDEEEEEEEFQEEAEEDEEEEEEEFQEEAEEDEEEEEEEDDVVLEPSSPAPLAPPPASPSPPPLRLPDLSSASPPLISSSPPHLLPIDHPVEVERLEPPLLEQVQDEALAAAVVGEYFSNLKLNAQDSCSFYKLMFINPISLLSLLAILKPNLAPIFTSLPSASGYYIEYFHHITIRHDAYFGCVPVSV